MVNFVNILPAYAFLKRFSRRQRVFPCFQGFSALVWPQELANGEYENVLSLLEKVYPEVLKGRGRVEALSVRSLAYERSNDWENASLGKA